MGTTKSKYYVPVAHDAESVMRNGVRHEQDGGSQWPYRREDTRVRGQDNVGPMTLCAHLTSGNVPSAVSPKCPTDFVEGAACIEAEVSFNSRKTLIRHDCEDSP